MDIKTQFFEMEKEIAGITNEMMKVTEEYEKWQNDNLPDYIKKWRHDYDLHETGTLIFGNCIDSGNYDIIPDLIENIKIYKIKIDEIDHERKLLQDQKNKIYMKYINLIRLPSFKNIKISQIGNFPIETLIYILKEDEDFPIDHKNPSHHIIFEFMKKIYECRPIFGSSAIGILRYSSINYTGKYYTVEEIRKLIINEIIEKGCEFHDCIDHCRNYCEDAIRDKCKKSGTPFCNYCRKEGHLIHKCQNLVKKRQKNKSHKLN